MRESLTISASDTCPLCADENTNGLLRQYFPKGIDFCKADKVAVYQDLGISSGMELGIQFHKENNTPIEYRSLDGWKDL